MHFVSFISYITYKFNIAFPILYFRIAMQFGSRHALFCIYILYTAFPYLHWLCASSTLHHEAGHVISQPVTWYHIWLVTCFHIWRVTWYHNWLVTWFHIWLVTWYHIWLVTLYYVTSDWSRDFASNRSRDFASYRSQDWTINCSRDFTFDQNHITYNGIPI